MPFQEKLSPILKWGITFNKFYEISEKSARKVAYADRWELEQEIIKRHVTCVDAEEEPEPADTAVHGGMNHTPVQEPPKSNEADSHSQPELKHKPPLQTD